MRGIIIIAAILGLVFLFANYGRDGLRENAKAACITAYEANTEGLIGEAVNTENFCACIVDVASVMKREDLQFFHLKPCLDRHVRPAVTSVCETEVNAQLRGGAMDCGCFYEEIAALMWQFNFQSKTSITRAEEEEINRSLVNKCVRS